MKSLLILVAIITSGIASAEQCGENLQQVQNIIDQNPKWKLSETHTKKFLGSWGHNGQIRIENYGNFAYETYTFQVCPQADGSMKIVNKAYPSYFGFLKIKNTKDKSKDNDVIEISGFQGLASKANRDYARAGSSLYANGDRSSF